jgi:hypothetical protein
MANPDVHTFAADWPVLDIEIATEHLTGPLGFFNNRHEHGRDWERPAHITLHQGSSTLVDADVGLRLHGGTKRNWRKYNAFRIYFRKSLGIQELPPGAIFEEREGPVRTLVLRWDRTWFASPMAYAIGSRIGVQGPPTRPVIFRLNGELQGPYYLLLHQGRRQLKATLGHSKFESYRYKSGDIRPKAYSDLVSWAKNTNAPIDIDSARDHIDLEGFSRYLFGILFCGVSDGMQGIAILEGEGPDQARWTWRNWDMDSAFVDNGPGWLQGTRPAWAQETIELLLSDRDFRAREQQERALTGGDVRKIIFTRLFRGDPGFRKYFLELSVRILNHELTQTYLTELDGTYRELLGESYPWWRSDFLSHRSDFVLQELGRFFEAGPPLELELATALGAELVVDEVPEIGPWRGHYFAGQVVELRFAEPEAVRG